MLITMLSVGYGDITPKTEAEIIITMFATIAGIVFFGILLGSIAEALTVSPSLLFRSFDCPASPWAAFQFCQIPLSSDVSDRCMCIALKVTLPLLFRG